MRWHECHEKVKQFRDGKYSEELGSFLGSPFQSRIIRLMKGALYMDWPWGRKRVTMQPSVLRPLYALLRYVHDMSDAVFMMGEEIAFVPFNVPFPSFSSSPSFKNAEMPCQCVVW
jgi:hypothetical protein